MGWDVITTIGAGEESNGFYPLLSSDLTVTPELLDGATIGTLPVISLSVLRLVNGSWRSAVHISDIKLDTYFTANRLVVYSRKWSKGGFVGSTGAVGLLIAATTAAVSAAKASNRTKHRALAGHVRWEWVFGVGWRPRTLWQTNAISIAYIDATGDGPTPCQLFLELNRGIDTQAAARMIADRILAYHYSSGEEFSTDEWAQWESVRTSGPIPQTGKEISWMEFPTYCPVGSAGYPTPSTIAFPAVATRQ